MYRFDSRWAWGTGGMKLVRQNEEMRERALYSPQIFHGLTWTQDLAVRNRLRASWAMKRPLYLNCRHCAEVLAGASSHLFHSLRTYVPTRAIKVTVENAASNSLGQGFKYRPVDRISLPSVFVLPSVRFGTYMLFLNEVSTAWQAAGKV
jgi:hypothetical protein